MILYRCHKDVAFKRGGKKLVRFLINVPDDLHRIMKEAAAKQGDTLNGLIRQILWNWYDAQQKSTSVGADA